MTEPAVTQAVDAAIIGGGIAGTWALNLLLSRGYSAVLLEADHLGCDQTLASQGMIHGGLKYALSGKFTGASEAIADMPRRWRACLQGTEGTKEAIGARGPTGVDLRGTRLLSERYYLFAAGSTLGKLTTFFASKTLRGRIEKLAEDDWPAPFAGFDGVVYALNDFVLDTADLLRRLSHGLETHIYQLAANASNVQPARQGGYSIRLQDTTLHAAQLISCAGNGSAALLEALAIPDLQVQQRPLKQVMVKPRHDVHLYAHCVTGITRNEPRLTITSHDCADGMVWYLGGQLSTQGVYRSDEEQIRAARAELEVCVPWLNWQDAEFQTLTVNRAEPRQSSGLRPDQAYVQRVGDFIQCFPTKLTLAPDLGDRLLAALPEPAGLPTVQSNHPRAEIGTPPWSHH